MKSKININVAADDPFFIFNTSSIYTDLSFPAYTSFTLIAIACDGPYIPLPISSIHDPPLNASFCIVSLYSWIINISFSRKFLVLLLFFTK